MCAVGDCQSCYDLEQERDGLRDRVAELESELAWANRRIRTLEGGEVIA